MTYKDLFYFTGQCLALDEHPQFREKIIELFTDANAQPETWSREQGTGSMEAENWESFVQLCSDQLIIPAIYLQFRKHNLLNCSKFPVRENMSVEMSMKGSGLVPDARLTSNGGQGTKDLHIHNSSTDLEFLTPACGSYRVYTSFSKMYFEKIMNILI